jgi:hypothetical protein
MATNACDPAPRTHATPPCPATHLSLLFTDWELAWWQRPAAGGGDLLWRGPYCFRCRD